MKSCLLLLLLAAPAAIGAQDALSVGTTFTMPSRVMGEERRINVYRPPVADSAQLPVVYLLDGGIAEDFLHIAGLVQVFSGNGAIRPLMLVGIENTQRRRDLTGPTTVASDSAIAPRVGGSALFRRFLREELLPEVRRRYRVTDEAALMGESLAGLFVVETLLDDPAMFTSYIAVDPSLWWNRESLVGRAAMTLRMRKPGARTLFVASSSQPEIAAATTRLANALRETGLVQVMHAAMPGETHGTIFHPAAMRALRAVFAP